MKEPHCDCNNDGINVLMVFDSFAFLVKAPALSPEEHSAAAPPPLRIICSSPAWRPHTSCANYDALSHGHYVEAIESEEYDFNL
jgi:hypothetical protein